MTKYQLTDAGLIPVPMLRSQAAFGRLDAASDAGAELCRLWNEHVRACEMVREDLWENRAFMRSHNAVVRAVRVDTKARAIRKHLAAWGDHVRTIA